MKRVFVIGLDGATFDLLGPWIDQGKLPTLKSFREKGAWGELTTVFPPVTPAAWTSFMTGKNPGKHGIYDFFYRKPDSYGMAPCNGNSRDGKAVWEILGEKGKRVIIVNVPMTYPPNEVNGCLLTGIDTPRSLPVHMTNYTYPKGLRKEILSRTGDYVIQPAEVYRRGRIPKLIKDLKYSLERRYQVVSYLMEQYPWDFFMVVFTETDRIQHDLWHLIDPKHPEHREDESSEYEHTLSDFFQDIDQKIGLLMDRLDDDTTVMMMSDHGHGPSYKWIYLNNWLRKQGFMFLRRDPLSLFKNLLFKLGWTPSSIYAMMTRLGFSKARVGWGARSRILSDLFLSERNIDWSKTVAYSVGHVGQIFLNVRGREPKGIVSEGEEYDRLRDRIREALETWKDPHTGENVVERVIYREEIYQGEYVRKAADILFLPTRFEYWTLGVSSFVSNRILGPAFGNSSNHRMNGLFMATGKDIRAGVNLSRASIMDVAPTLLHDLQMPIPSDMDGRVLEEIFNQDFLRRSPISYDDALSGKPPRDTDYTDEEEQAVIRRLQDLGYLG